jgi:hypothetical protein
VAEQPQFPVVGRRAPRQQHQPFQQLAEAQIDQSERHPPIIWIKDPDGELAAQSLRLTFWHPHLAEHPHHPLIQVDVVNGHADALGAAHAGIN